MAQYRNINVRSPFYVQLPTTQPLVRMELRVWNGDLVTDKPAEANYKLEKEQAGGQSTFEIAELIRDFCSQTSALNSGVAWVEVILNDLDATPTTVIYLASEGYSLYKEGIQHNGNTYESDFVALPSESTDNFRILTTETTSSVFHVYTQPQDSVSWKYRTYDSAGTPASWVVMPQTTLSNEQFVPFIADSTISRFEFDFNGDFQNVYVDLAECNKYNNGDSATKEDKPVVLFYVNKYGVKNYIPFTMKHMENIQVSSDKYNTNVMNISTLSNGNGLHASRKRITGSKQSFVINTDWLPEYYVNQLEELIMSEYVWSLIPNVDDNNFQPVNLSTSQLSKKNHLNDKLIQYTFKLETASEYINTVR